MSLPSFAILFGDLRTLGYEDVDDEADWDPGPKSRLIRFVGEDVPVAVPNW